MLWSSTAYQTSCEYSNEIRKSDARKLETNSEAANLGKWSLPVHKPATYVNAEKLRKELMSSFKVALKDVVSKLHWKFQITVLEICAQWSFIQRFRAAMKQTSVRNIWSESSDFELQSDTSEHEKSAFSHAQKRSEVLIHHLPKFKSLTYQSTSAVRNSPVSFHQLSSHQKVKVNCPHTKLKTSDGSSWSSTFCWSPQTKSPMLSEVARSSSQCCYL